MRGSQDMLESYFGEDAFSAQVLWLLQTSQENWREELVALCLDAAVPWQKMVPVFRAGTVADSMELDEWLAEVSRPIGEVMRAKNAPYVLAVFWGLLEGGCWVMERNLVLNKKKSFYQTIAFILYHSGIVDRQTATMVTSEGDFSNRLSRFLKTFREKGEDAAVRIIEFYLLRPQKEPADFGRKVLDQMTHTAFSQQTLAERLKLIGAKS